MPHYPHSAEVVTTQPGYVPNVSHVVYQTVGIALAMALGAGLWAAGLAWLHVLRVAPGLAFLAGAAIAFLPCLVWRVFAIDHSLSVKRVESQYGVDIDGDGRIADKPADAWLAVNPEQAQREADAAAEAEAQRLRMLDLIAWIERCYTVGTSESAQGVKPAARDEYLRNRDLLFRLGLAEWRDPQRKQSGWQMRTDQAHTIKAVRSHVLGR